jgi:FkbM family methyltransferase
VKGKTRLDNLLRQWFWKPDAVRVIHDIRMELDPTEWTQLQLIKRNWLEPATIALYEKLLRPGDVFVDVGAHVGFHSLVARKAIGSDGLVLAVEPQPYNASRILANWRANGWTNLNLYVAAAGNRNGTVWLHDQAADDRSVLSLLPGKGKNRAQRYQVPLRRLEDIMAEAEVPSVRVLKIDVEGLELEVLEGMGPRLRCADNIIFEFLQAPGRETEDRRLLDFLRDHGFDLLTIRGEAWAPGDEIPERNLRARRRSGPNES